jgi:hypothetical protein
MLAACGDSGGGGAAGGGADGGADVGGAGPECNGQPCAPDQACVDYVTDMSTGTQCVTLAGTGCARDDCACANEAVCEGDATCEIVPGGVHLSGCFFPP